MPAVSGSSGRLIVSGPAVADGERDYPGRVFERQELSYRGAMDAFVRARQEAQGQESATGEEVGQGERQLKGLRRELRAEEQRLRVERGKERERCWLIDAAWKERRKEHREAVESVAGLTEVERQERGRRRAALLAQYRAEWHERHRDLAQRRERRARWQQERKRLRERQQGAGLVQVMAWIAILVIVDNCTRRCLGLPLFAMGAHVTAELVVDALKALLPKGLEYLIADGGQHFTADALKALAEGRGFVRVPLAKHRPQSNGIAERFVETLKDWLAKREWHTAEELQPLLSEFVTYYNDRPHQGLELAGLSPNEYTARLPARLADGHRPPASDPFALLAAA